MAQRNNWLWKYFNKLNKFNIQCNFCDKIYKYGLEMTPIAHLYQSHKVYNKENVLDWINDIHPIWQYFSKVELYTVKCKICSEIWCDVYNKSWLEEHLIQRHSQLIIEIRNKITSTWLPLHFTLNTENCSTNCMHCNYSIRTFYGIDVLKNHLRQTHNIWDYVEELEIVM